MAVIDLLPQRDFDIKVKANGYYHKVNIKVDGSKLQLHFPYNPDVLKEVKETFEGRRYLGFDEKKGKIKAWEIPITARNLFRLEVLQGKYSDVKPYEQFENVEKYDLSEQILAYSQSRVVPTKPYKHQVQMVNQALIGRWFIWAAEMGTGKTLAAIIAMEMMRRRYDLKDILWAGPRSALIAAKIDFAKWGTHLNPDFYTYEGVRDLVEKWPSGKPPPQMVIFDEASKLKNPVAKRTQAAKYLADMMRQQWGIECLIGLLSKTPAPKSPADWWSLCEIACPGFIREGHINAFRNRLAIVEKRETVPGAGMYDHILGWRDSTEKCTYCNQKLEHPNHAQGGMQRFMSSLGENKGQTHEVHEFKACENEVAQLKHRTRGLVGVWLKEDCLDLPKKRYEVIRVKPSRATLNAAKIISQTSSRSLEAHILLRELSDGFQYQNIPTGNLIECPTCKGHGHTVKYVDRADVSRTFTDAEIAAGKRFIWTQPGPEDDPDFFIPEKIGEEDIVLEEDRETCWKCKGEKTVPELRRETVEVECPKDQVLIDLLERHEEVGRFCVYGGFTGTIERIIKICHKEGWATIRADGQGWKGQDHTGTTIYGTAEDLMKIFTLGGEDYPLVCFVGQAGAAGMGLTLTASPSIFFFSNTFNGEDRDQAESRGHRIGMREDGGVIIDCYHLPTDEKVHDNLKMKKDLQYMSMKGIQKALELVDVNV